MDHTGPYQPIRLRSIAYLMPKTQSQIAELALIRIIQDPKASIKQVLDATRQLQGFKRLKPKTRAKRKGRGKDVSKASSTSVLGSK